MLAGTVIKLLFCFDVAVASLRNFSFLSKSSLRVMFYEKLIGEPISFNYHNNPIVISIKETFFWIPEIVVKVFLRLLKVLP